MLLTVFIIFEVKIYKIILTWHSKSIFEISIFNINLIEHKNLYWNICSLIFNQIFVANINGVSSQKLNELAPDCLEHILGYLFKEDLAALGATCTSLQKSVGRYIRDNFNSKAYIENGTISESRFDKILINHFSHIIRRISIVNCDLDIFKSNRFDLVREIEFYRGNLHVPRFFNKILSKVKSLTFYIYSLDNDFHKTLLSPSEKLKHLYVSDLHSNVTQQNVIIGTSNHWLTEKYQTLKKFEFMFRRKFDKVIQFLKLNPNIQWFSTTIEFFIANNDLLSTSRIKLNVLSIKQIKNIKDDDYNQFIDQLKMLHQNGFFQQLHLR